MGTSPKTGTELLKTGFARMVKHGVVMDVTNADQAVIAEQAGLLRLWPLSGFRRIYALQAVLRGWRLLRGWGR